ncbi:MAG: winged helix-turn-helix domain-containing protein [Nanoarchaeota archaeon]|nr:winged helix-turn-helix domain-containing protein [Nanoarchaeota archaeon]
MVIRKTSQQIKKEILEFLFEGPKSINEIKEKLGSNWPTINSYLEKLKEEGKVNEILVTDKMKVYRRTDDPVYYSLPFNKDIRIKTLYILSEIEKEWKRKRPTELSKTALQKLAVDVIKMGNLNLPVLNFHYGMTTCASLDSTKEDIVRLIEEPRDKKIIIECIAKVVSDKKHTGIAYKEREYQYEKYKDEMKFYFSKEQLMKTFRVDNASEEIKQSLKNLLLDLSINFPIKLEDFYDEFENFISNSQIILSKKGKDTEGMEVIKETLTQLWDKMTTFTSFQDSEMFIDNDKKQLFNQIMELNLNFKELNYKVYIEELESFAQNINPFDIDLPQTENSKQIQKLILEGLGDE